MNQELLKLDKVLKAFDNLPLAAKLHVGYALRHQSEASRNLLKANYAKDQFVNEFILLLVDEGYIAYPAVLMAP